MISTTTNRGLRGLAVCIALGTSVVLATPAGAATISATEYIADSQPFDVFVRDLTRTRGSSVQGVAIETDDAAIAADNLVDNDFGLVNGGSVSYTHSLTWLNPPAGSYSAAILTIYGWGNIGGNDLVFSDAIDLGALSDGTLQSLLFSTTSFDVLAEIVDDVLNVEIRKNVGARGLGAFNVFSVYGSRLDVRYETVPEPASLVLWGTGLAGLAAVLRRRQRAREARAVDTAA